MTGATMPSRWMSRTSHGASPRAASALAAAARAAAALEGRDYVIPDDVKLLAQPLLRHRVVLSPAAEIDGRRTDDIVAQLIDRVEAFARQYTDRLTVLDAASCAMPGISPETRALISPVILATLLERLTAHLAIQRNHPLNMRRYYRKVAY